MKNRILCLFLVFSLIAGLAVAASAVEQKELSDKTITKSDIILVLDPGHGGKDPGAVANDLLESDNNLAIAQRVAQRMTQWGCQVVMTYAEPLPQGTDLSLLSRVQLANALPADVFLSIHTNSLDLAANPAGVNVSGISTYYQQTTEKGKELASRVQQAVIASTGANNRGIVSGNLFVNRETEMDSALIEVGFITNPQECARMKTDAYRDQLAAGIAQGLQNYITEVTIPARQAIEDEPDPTPTASGVAYRVTASRLNCRNAPRTGAPLSTVFLQGDVVYTAGLETAQWLYVTDNFVTGWCSKAYLTPVTSSPSPSPSASPSPPVSPTPAVSPSPSPSTPVTPNGPQYVVTASTSLLCRSGPSSTASVVGSFPKGRVLTATGEAKNGWLPVTAGGISGWCSLSYLRLLEATPSPSPSASPSPSPSPSQNPHGAKYVVTASTSLLCRSGPSSTATVVGSFASGTVVTATGGAKNGWLPVTANGISGWCSLTYLRQSTITVRYVDVPASSPYYSAVNFVTQQGLFNGTSHNRFSPDASMTRAMAMTVLNRLSKLDASFQLPASQPKRFSDVPAGSWYYDAVGWAGGTGLAEGTGGGRFSPDAPMTREALSVLLYRYGKMLGLTLNTSASLSGYEDAGQVSSWAKEAVSWCVSTGLYPAVGKRLNPTNAATRAQVAMMLETFVKQFQ